MASDEDVESITISGGTVSVMSSEVDINNESGWVSPGSSPGLLEIEGDYTVK